MTRSATCSLLASLLLGCPGGGSDKDTHAGDTADAGLDVSGLLCAGLEGLDERSFVPRTNYDGCDGGVVRGELSCVGCSFWPGEAEIWLDALWRGESGSNFIVCNAMGVPADGSFDFGVVAPFDEYSLDFSGRLQSGALGSLRVRPTFEVCSDDVWIEAEVEEVTDAG